MEHERLASAHRENYGFLLAANPNYFGNLPGSGLKSEFPLLTDTGYEELTCVAYDPARRLLEATFQVKRPYGFEGGLCANGSWEYVRFWLDYGAGWVDGGLTAVNVHDLPAGTDCAGADVFPLSYTATLAIGPESTFCFGPPRLPKVRAILSWNTEPPAAPSTAVPVPADWTPVFGNVLETHVQIATRPLILLDVLHELKVDAAVLPGPMQQAVKVPIPLPDPPPLNVAQLAELYHVNAGKDVEAQSAQLGRAFTVPAHRFGAAAITPALAAAAPLETLAVAESWKTLGLDWAGAVAALTELDGDVNYEQIDCVGLDVTRSRLVATIAVKRPNGYLGGLCGAGSTEYVAFWGDFGGSDCALTYLGTATVAVHDIPSIPAGGLSYAAVLPVDLSAFTKSCDEPVIGRIRAVLSWNTPPSTTDPQAVPFWGNRLDTHVQLPPKTPGSGTGPNVWAVGGVGVVDLDSSYNPIWMTTSGSGLTRPNAHFALTGLATDPRPSPFGARVVVQGDPVLGGSYRVQVRNKTTNGAWTTLVNELYVIDTHGTPGANAPAGEYYPYLDRDHNEDSVLAQWDTTGNDLWEIKLDARDAANTPLGEVRYLAQLDNTAPSVDIHIDPAIGGDCNKFAIGTTIGGHFFAQDPQDHFGKYNLSILPAHLPGGTGVLTPATGTVPTAPAPGDPWHLETHGMSACAYVAIVEARDRTIVNSSGVGWYSGQVAVGFSLQ
jgi:hypothetical protein